MLGLRKVPVHKALTRRQLVAGCDRELFFGLMGVVAMLVATGMIRAYWRNVVIGIIVWFAGVRVLAKLAIYDGYFRPIVLRSMRYANASLSACGKLGRGVRAVVHNRWS